jgi:hypothetical protein
MKKKSEALLFLKYSKSKLQKLQTVGKLPLASELYSNYSLNCRISSSAKEVVDRF